MVYRTRAGKRSRAHAWPSGTRGFGAPQILGIIVILLVAIVLTVVLLVNFSSSFAKRESSYTEMAQARAHMVLHNALLSPMSNPPAALTAVFPQPTLGDFVASQDLDKTGNRTLLAQELQVILDGMDDPERGRFSTYVVYLDSAELLRSNKKDRYPGYTVKGPLSACSTNPRKNDERLSEAKIRIPSAKRDHVLQLQYCWTKVMKK